MPRAAVVKTKTLDLLNSRKVRKSAMHKTRQGRGAVLDLMVVQIGFSVWAGTATPPPVGCPPELYELMGNFSFV